jgi:NinB protein.
MGRAALTLPHGRPLAHAWIDKAPPGTRIMFQGPQRTTDQNAKMWAMLTDVARAEPEGRKHTTDVWKAIFMHALGHETRFERGLNGEIFPIGFRSSQLSKQEMSDLIEVIYEYGSRYGVEWSE